MKTESSWRSVALWLPIYFFYSVILYAGNWPDFLRYQQCLDTNLQYDPPQDRELRPEEMDGMLCC